MSGTKKQVELGVIACGTRRRLLGTANHSALAAAESNSWYLATVHSNQWASICGSNITTVSIETWFKFTSFNWRKLYMIASVTCAMVKNNLMQYNAKPCQHSHGDYRSNARHFGTLPSGAQLGCQAQGKKIHVGVCMITWRKGWLKWIK